MKIIFSTIWAICFVTPLLGQSQRRLDSILKIAYDASAPTSVRVRALAKLSGFYPEKSWVFAREALIEAQKAKNPADISYAYSYLATSYLSVDSPSLVQPMIDSAIQYGRQSKDPLAQGIAYYRNGWFANINNQVAEAFLNWEKALSLLNGVRAGAIYRSGIYYLYFGVYAERGDVDNEENAARLSLYEAQQSGEHDMLPAAWQINGTAYLDRFDMSKDSLLLDSALNAFKNSVKLYEQYKEEQHHKNTMALSALYTAKIYMDYFSDKHQDSVIYYTNIALANTDTASSNATMLINCYNILSKYDLEGNRIQAAEELLLKSLALFEAMPIKDFYVGQNLYFELAVLYEKKGEIAQSLAYYKQYVDYYKKEFDAHQFETAKRLEARYQNEKKEKEISFLKANEIFHKKENGFYLGIAVVALLGLVFMFRSYHYRLKFSMQREKTLLQEKEEADLQSRLKAEEAARLHLEKQEAELQSRLQSEEAARLYAEHELMKARQGQLHKELLAGALQVQHKNEVLQNLKHKLTEERAIKQPIAKQLEKILNEELRTDEDFENFKSEFKDIHPEFFNKLNQVAKQKLTALDLRYCAYISMKLNSKQIAGILHVEPKSVRMARYRLKQKFGLAKEDVLETFVEQLIA